MWVQSYYFWRCCGVCAAIILLRKVDEIRQIFVIFVELYKINTVLLPRRGRRKMIKEQKK